MKLRPGQSLVLQQLQSGNDVAANLPTGYGKTLCYEIPVRVWRWKVLVLSPLQSLILDQERRFKSKRVRTVAYCGAMVGIEQSKFNKGFLSRDWDIAICSPEKLMQLSKKYESQIKQIFEDLDLVVLDEAHVYTQWENFRFRLPEALRFLADRATKQRILLASATLLGSECAYLQQTLGRKLCSVRLSPLAENLRLLARCLDSEEERKLQLCALLRDLNAPNVTIVYCESRSRCEALAEFLREFGISALPFHAGLSSKAKQKNYELFTQGKASVVCATSAFGLGIDHKFVRMVIHYGLPFSISQYVQEIGRAGRDCKPAVAIALVLLSDLESHLQNIESAVRIRESISIWRYLFTSICRRRILNFHFDVCSEEKCHSCDICDENLVFKLFPQLNFRMNKVLPWWAQHKEATEKYIQEQIWFRFRRTNC